MKECPVCHYNNNDDDLKCQKCNYIFKSKTTIKKEDKENDWPSDEWKDWNLK